MEAKILYETHSKANKKWVHIATEEVDDVADFSELDRIYAMWNNGSGSESEKFRESGVRSMSVGDVVVLGDIAYECCQHGWLPIDLHDEVFWLKDLGNGYVLVA